MSFRPVLAAGAACLLASSIALAEEPALTFLWLDTDNPSASGLFTEQIQAKPGDTLQGGLFLTPGDGGVNAYQVSLDFDADLANELDLLGCVPTPPSGWTDNGIGGTQESDGVQGGFIQGISADGPGIVGPDPLQIVYCDFTVQTGILDDGADLTPNLLGPGDQILNLTNTSVPPGDVLIGEGVTERQGPYQYAPGFFDKFDSYGFPVDFNGVKAKTKTVGKKVLPKGTRGVEVKASDDSSFGFYQVPIAISSTAASTFPITQTLQVDVTGLDTPGAFAGVELDSPFVPIGGTFNNFLFSGVSRESDGSVTIFVNDNGVNTGTPLNLPADTQVVFIDFAWDGTLVDVDAGPYGGTPTALVTDLPFAAADDAGIGFGVNATNKGDKVGMTFAISGDLYDATRKMVLDDLQAIIQLELDASADIDASNPAGAKTKLEAAKRKLEQGEPIPNTNPVQYTGGLIQKVNGWLSSGDKETEKVRKEIEKRLEKAAKRDEKAIDAIDKGQPNDKIKKQIEKGRSEKVKAKAVIETLAKKESKKDA